MKNPHECLLSILMQMALILALISTPSPYRLMLTPYYLVDQDFSSFTGDLQRMHD
jgi:hypothetical protein